MKRSGFTLIELIVVLVILGVLAIVAAPKFLNLQQDARITTLEGFKTAMQGVITQVQSKSYIEGLTPEATNPGNSAQDRYIIDFGIGSVEVDWGTLCPESRGEQGDSLTMIDFMILDESGGSTFDFGNRHTVIGYDYSFTTNELNRTYFADEDLPDGCYVIYDSFGGRGGPGGNNNTCPPEAAPVMLESWIPRVDSLAISSSR
ncbi:MSHA pilin protein mshA [Vibrio ishigakensis]|uniref:MSHA pilin protein mshA n=1 Tax=Vibrio ishigakensis TaxID=1481914 RepID=A0A0B8PNE2_9VIBR|nr:MSHA pilin protein mshA [Vibrio ishigakensis]